MNQISTYDLHCSYCNLERNVPESDFREVLDQDYFGIYRRKGYKIPEKYKKRYKEFRKIRRYNIFHDMTLGFYKNCRFKTIFDDIILLIKLLKMGY